MALRIEAAVLLVLAVALAGPIPHALARARWASRSPRATLVLWQAVGLAGGLSILGAGLTLAASSLSSHWLIGVAALPTDWSRLGLAGWAGIAVTVTVGTWLLGVTAASSARVVAARRAHRDRLDAVTDAVPGVADALPGAADALPGAADAPPGVTDAPPNPRSDRRLEPRLAPQPVLAGVYLLDHPAAVAYCLPGLRPRIVVSSGALQTLAADELAAVLAHERAHARSRHDLVIQPFVAWRQTFPFLPAAATALATVDLLVEMLADDVARRRCPPRHLRAALAQMSAAHPDDGELQAQVTARRARLATPPRPLGRPLRALVYLAAVALVLVPPAVLLMS